MKVLVFGAGVIGCYLTHVLCEAGHDVTLLARGAWKDTLESHGLELRHHLQHRTTLDHPAVTDHIDETIRWDAVFAAMPYHQIHTILPQLAQADTDLLVLIGNNMRAAAMQEELLRLSSAPKEVLFAFQVTGGERLKDRAIVERFGKAGLDIGALHSLPSQAAREKLTALFKGTGYKMRWQPDMEAYLFCHPAAVLPIACLAYACGGDLRRSTRKQRRQMLDAPAEAYDRLTELGIPILPEKDDLFYRPGFRRFVMRILYFIMAKSSIGDLIACNHCRNAVAEMEMLDQDFTALLERGGKPDMPVWNALKAQMPSWEELHWLYDKKRRQWLQ
ncbi:MAG: ketopantoate reductase family protein [Clostridia bacterium]|nr:ketopantoate reductase family protein [Clostridia bacterium]